MIPLKAMGTPCYTKLCEPDKCEKNFLAEIFRVTVRVKQWIKENDAKLYDYESGLTENKEQEFEQSFPAALIQEGKASSLLLTGNR